MKIAPSQKKYYNKYYQKISISVYSILTYEMVEKETSTDNDASYDSYNGFVNYAKCRFLSKHLNKEKKNIQTDLPRNFDIRINKDTWYYDYNKKAYYFTFNVFFNDHEVFEYFKSKYIINNYDFAVDENHRKLLDDKKSVIFKMDYNTTKYNYRITCKRTHENEKKVPKLLQSYGLTFPKPFKTETGCYDKVGASFVIYTNEKKLLTHFVLLAGKSNCKEIHYIETPEFLKYKSK